jgi:hypothetical protein
MEVSKLKIRSIQVLVPLMALATMAFASSAQAYLGTGTGLGLSGTLSLYGAIDAKGHGAGFGLAYSTTQKFTGLVQDLSFTHVDKYNMYQYSALTSKTWSALPIDVGISIGYSDPSGISSVKRGIMTGVTAILAKTTPMSGLSLDLRVSSMEKGFNPVKWFSDPDSLIAGAGASYTF